MAENNQSKPEFDSNPATHPVRRVLVFQLKLACDAFRDILLSPVSIVAALIDWVWDRKNQQSYFEMLMKLGRLSDQKINLFDHYQGNEQTVDSIFSQVETVLKKEYQKGDISEKTKLAIEKSMLSVSKIKSRKKRD